MLGVGQAGEPLHAEHLLRFVTQAIDLAAGDHEPARCHFRLDDADYLVENDGRQWSLTAKAPPAPADVTVTATTQALTALIFAGSGTGIDITGGTGPAQRFRQLISTMATVVQLSYSPPKPPKPEPWDRRSRTAHSQNRMFCMQETFRENASPNRTDRRSARISPGNDHVIDHFA